MRILHLSDFHYIPKFKAEFEQVVRKLVESLSKQEPIDVIVFSGDLINKDASLEQFHDAASCLFTPPLEFAKLDKTRLLICPGNHDLSRDKEMKMVSDSLNTKKTSKELDDFCDDSEQLRLSLTRFDAYTQFVKEFYGNDIDIQPLYTTATHVINEKKIGLMSINSAWRSIESNKDRGNLLYPTRYLQEATSKMRGCDFVLCTMHHAVSDFKDYIEQEIENTIYENSHILFTGHYHKAKVSSILSSNGLLHSVACATFNYKDSISSYGYLILTIDEDTYDVKIESFPYTNGHFIPDEPLVATLPMSAEKRASNDFRRVMRKQLTIFREKSDNLFVKGRTSNIAGHTFSTLFSDPIIKDKSIQELLASRKSGRKISLEEIEDSDKSTIIFGRNKSGRTTLQYKFMIDFLQSYASRKVVPYYIACKELNGESLNLDRRLRDFLSLNKADLHSRFESYELVLLLDDLDVNDKKFLENLHAEIQSFKKVRFIATTEETLVNQCALMYFEDVAINNYYIHDVTPREVHQLTARWPNMPVANKQKYEENIVKILQQMHMPFNYWTISLFLWIFENTDASNIHNNFELINLYIDEILDKKSLITDKSFKVDYDDLKSYLAELAEYLLAKVNHRVSYDELVSFTASYIDSHKKFVEQTRDILDLLLRRGILVEEESIIDGAVGKSLYTFRLHGVFEYFIALRLAENPQLKDNILKDDSTYFSYGTELELYAGFKKEDMDAIQNIFGKTQSVLKPLSEKEGYNDVDKHLVEEIVIDSNKVQITGNLFDRIAELSEDEAEELLPVPSSSVGDSRVTQKIILTNIPPTAANIEKALFILSRVYRNSNACDHSELSDAILDFVITGVCNLGFMISDDVKSSELAEDDYKGVVQLMSNFMPIIVQTFFYDAICQQNLIRVFENKLNVMRQNPEGNEFRMFILAFILVDLNPIANSHYIEEILPYLKNRLLRFAVINKIILLMLGNADNKQLVARMNQIATPLMKEFKNFENVRENLLKEVEGLEIRKKMNRIGDSKDYK